MIYLYHRCPHCGYIQLDRQNFKEKFDVTQKEVECECCEKGYIDTGWPKKEADSL